MSNKERVLKAFPAAYACVPAGQWRWSILVDNPSVIGGVVCISRGGSAAQAWRNASKHSAVMAVNA